MASNLEDCVPNCPICVESFKAPKFIPCGHSLCLECLRSYVGDEEDRFKCPVCRTDVTIPENGIESFPTNFDLQNPTLQLEQVTQSPTETAGSPPFSGTEEAEAATELTIAETSSTPKQQVKCANHDKREIEFYCKDCEAGVCARCTLLDHKNHKYVDLESESTRTDVIQQLTIREDILKQKIENLNRRKTVLDGAMDQLSNHCEAITSIIQKHCADNQALLIQNKTETQQVLDNLNTGLKHDMPSITGDTTLALYEALHNLNTLDTSNNTPEVTSPVEYLQWVENSMDMNKDTLGSVKSVLLPIPDRNSFRFDIKEIVDNDWCYYSKDTVIDNDVVWSCVVVRDKDENIGIYIELQNFQNIVSADVSCSFTLLNTDKNKNLAETLSHKFTDKEQNWGYHQFTSWKLLSDKSEGFLDNNGRFIVEFKITEMRELRRK